MGTIDVGGIAGIDYGSRLAGTTRIAWINEKGGVESMASQKGQDADALILAWAAQARPDRIFLDAPLSLPRIYRFPAVEGDYFYREADKTLRAMSPLFLGGLTARAMQLRAQLEQVGILVFEVYPAHLARVLDIRGRGYKEKGSHPAGLVQELSPVCPFALEQLSIQDWHTFDAALALWSGWRFAQGEALSFGDPDEGLIHV
jgi:predicted nuclease with RNAse H fold